MTLVAVWYNNESPQDPQIWAAADTTISSVDTSLQGSEMLHVLTEQGSKILELPIVCKILPNKNEEIYFRTSLGFAFAGSSLVGLNAYSTLASLLSSLGSTVDTKALPDYASILNTAKQIVTYYSRSVRDLVEVCIYGFCPKTNKPFISKITSSLIEEQHVYSIEEQLLTEDLRCTYLGFKAGYNKLEELITKAKAITLKGDNFLYWRIPATALNTIVNKKLFPTIGGGVQFGVAGIGYYNYLYNVVKVDGEPRIIYRNIDLRHNAINKIGDCYIAINGLIL